MHQLLKLFPQHQHFFLPKKISKFSKLKKFLLCQLLLLTKTPKIILTRTETLPTRSTPSRPPSSILNIHTLLLINPCSFFTQFLFLGPRQILTSLVESIEPGLGLVLPLVRLQLLIHKVVVLLVRLLHLCSRDSLRDFVDFLDVTGTHVFGDGFLVGRECLIVTVFPLVVDVVHDLVSHDFGLPHLSEVSHL